MAEIKPVKKEIEILWKGHALGEDIDPDTPEYPKDKITELFTMESNTCGGHWTEEFEIDGQKFRLWIHTTTDQPTQEEHLYEGWINAIYSETELTEDQRASVIKQCGIEPNQLNPMDINDVAHANLFNVATDSVELLWKELRRGCQVIINKFNYMMDQYQNPSIHNNSDGWYWINTF